MTENEIKFNEVLKSIKPQDCSHYSFYIEGNIIGGSLLYDPGTKQICRYKHIGTYRKTGITTLTPLTTNEETELYEDIRRGMVKIIQRGRVYPISEHETILLNLSPVYKPRIK